jgi:hypothetical protein
MALSSARSVMGASQIEPRLKGNFARTNQHEAAWMPSHANTVACKPNGRGARQCTNLEGLGHWSKPALS